MSLGPPQGSGGGGGAPSGAAGGSLAGTYPNPTISTSVITAAAATVLDDATVAAMVDTLGGASSVGTGGLARSTAPTFVTSVQAPAYKDTNGAQLLGTRITGWTVGAATQTRTGLSDGFTVAQVEARLAALIADLVTHGVIGA